MSMQSDNAVLMIGEDGRAIESFESYSVTSNLYEAADAFDMTLSDVTENVQPGDLVKLKINDKIELSGVVDTVEKTVSKSGTRLKITGRDLMGLLVDHHVETFGSKGSMSGKKLKAIAETLIAEVHLCKRMTVAYADDAEKIDKPKGFVQVDPGTSVFDVLRTYATGSGFLFFSEPGAPDKGAESLGRIVFAKPKSRGEPVFSITCKTDGDTGENNIIEGTYRKSIAGAYSKVTVTGQAQVEGDLGETRTTTVKGSATTDALPYYKPMVTQRNIDSRSPKMLAQHMVERMVAGIAGLEYTVVGHAQNGRNWAVNEFCRVDDAALGVIGTFLIYERTFTMSQSGGAVTRILLGAPGLTMETE